MGLVLRFSRTAFGSIRHIAPFSKRGRPSIMHLREISSDMAMAKRAPYKVLVAGGSYAGLSAALNLLDLCNGKPCRFSMPAQSEQDAATEKIKVQITIVDERDGYYHLIGTPLAFVSRDYAEKTWRKFQDIPALQAPEIKCIRGRITGVNCEQKTATIFEVEKEEQIEDHYDYFVAATGLERNWPSAPQSLTREEYLLETRKHIKQIENVHDDIVVIGGGAVGIEMAGELKLTHPAKAVTLIHSRPKLLSSEPLPDDYRDHILSLLHKAGVETILGARVQEILPSELKAGFPPSSTITLDDGRKIKAGHVIKAISKYRPTTSYLPEIAMDENGYVKISAELNFPSNVPNAEYHYAAGDLTLWPGIKRGGAAMYHGHYAATNIYQRMRNDALGVPPEFVEIERSPPVICIAVGTEAAAWTGENGTISGEDVLDLYFNNDLGHQICWNYMKLGEHPPSP